AIHTRHHRRLQQKRLGRCHWRKPVFGRARLTGVRSRNLHRNVQCQHKHYCFLTQMTTMKLRRIYYLIAALSVPLTALSQSVIHGSVRDAETRQPLPYCNVQVTGTGSGTTTDVNGRFTIDAGSNSNVRLILSYVGYQTDTVTVSGDRQSYTFYLAPDSKSLEEVVVVSGTMKEVTRMNSPIPVEIYSPA